MKRRVFVSAVNVRLPAVDDLFLFEQILTKPQLDLEPEVFMVKPSIEALIFHLNLDQNSQYYPGRKDVKVMREDVIAATICAQEILDQADVPMTARSHIPLYMSSSVCLDELLSNINDISLAYVSKDFPVNLAEKHKRVEKATPPLFVLNALTNGAESFVSQYSGVKGDNTVFGNTSHASFDCLIEGVRAIHSGSDMALIGSSNGAGLLAALTFDNLRQGPTAKWKLSNGAAFILLESEESVMKRKRVPLAELVNLKKGTSVPRLFTIEENPYKDIDPQSKSVFYSGGLGEGDFLKETSEVSKRWEKYYSPYSLFGHLGVVSPLLNLVGGCLKLKAGISNIDCLNRDPYGRESLVHLRQVK